MLRNSKKIFNLILVGLIVVFAYAMISNPFAVLNSKARYVAYQELGSELRKLYHNDNLDPIYLDQSAFTEDQEYVNLEVFSKITSTVITRSRDLITIANQDQQLVVDTYNGYLQNSNRDVYELDNNFYQEDSKNFVLADLLFESLGYEAIQNSGDIYINRLFATKRLLVKGDLNTFKGASNIIKTANNLYLLQYADEASCINAYNYYSSLRTIEYVEPDRQVEVEDVEINETITDDGSGNYYSWGANVLNVFEYNQYVINTYGINNLPTRVVAVLDTGIDINHPMFTNRLYPGGANYSPSSGTHQDVEGHGTHVAGTVVDLTLPNVKILPIKVLGDDGKGYTSGIVSGIEYVISLKQNSHEIVAINMSLGGDQSPIGGSTHRAYDNVIKSAFNNGIVTVVAAGNDSTDANTHSPANVSTAITVSAIGYRGENYVLADFSNYGSVVDVAAPGVGITSAAIGGGYVNLSGTSMASPHVAAVVAMLCSIHDSSFTPEQVVNTITSTAQDHGFPGWDPYFGHGIVDTQYLYAEIMEPGVIFSDQVANHNSDFNLKLLSNDPNAVIYYTIDGSNVAFGESILYTEPILINTSTQVRARSYIVENGRVVKISAEKNFTYVLYGQDIANPYQVSEQGVIMAYHGVLVDIVVPSVINGRTILTIGEYAFNGNQIRSVVLPSTVTLINENAFFGLTSLTSFVGPSVNKIGAYAFKNCQELVLNNDDLPLVESVGKEAFAYCYKLTSFNFTNVKTVDNGAFKGCSSISDINAPLLTTIGVESFAEMNSLRNVYMDNLKTISEKSFINCSYLYKVSANKVLNVGLNAFENCIFLENVSFDSLQTIADRAFANTGVKNISLPRLVTIGKEVFSKTLTQMTIGRNLINIPKGSLNTKKLIGYPGSSVHTYATNNDISFSALATTEVTKDIPNEVIVAIGSDEKITINANGYQVRYQWFVSPYNTTYIGTQLSETSNVLTLDTSTVGTLYYYFKVIDWDSKIAYTSAACPVSVIDSSITHTIVATAGQNGTITPSGTIECMEGVSKTFYFKANKGFVISDVKVDGISVGTPDSYTFDSIRAAHTISVEFVRDQIVAYSISGIGGTIDSAEKVIVEYGQSKTYQIKADKGYAILAVYVNSVNIGAVSSVTINFTESVTIYVVFYRVSQPIGPGGHHVETGTNIYNPAVRYGE